MKALEIRPHHGLCAEFFRGMGYSGDFAENMGRVLGKLDRENPPVRLIIREDVICARCPNSGKCGEKAERYDKRVLEICGLAEGTELLWREYRRLVRERVVLAGRLEGVCGDCIWADICRTNQPRVDFFALR